MGAILEVEMRNEEEEKLEAIEINNSRRFQSQQAPKVTNRLIPKEEIKKDESKDNKVKKKRRLKKNRKSYKTENLNIQL